MILIIGAGLAGLTCARVLQQAGVDFLLVEAGPVPGGRVATTVTEEGFRLDHGFQVLNASYPAVREHLDVAALQPRWLDSGAILADGGRRWTVGHPLRHPGLLLRTVLGGYAGWADKMRLGQMAIELWLGNDDTVWQGDQPGLTTRRFLEQAGFSAELLERFLRPFFGGVLLDNELASSAALFRYDFRQFIRGQVFVPASGMAAIPAQLAAGLPPDRLRLGTEVARLEGGRKGVPAIILENGERITASRMVLATSEPVSARLLRQPAPPPGRRVTVAYFQSATPLYGEKLLVLPAGRDRMVRHFMQITNAAPEYAPSGRHLLSATILDRRGMPDETLGARAWAEIADVFPEANRDGELLRIVDVPYAVPEQGPGFAGPRRVQPPTGVVLAGDYLTHGSIQGAMASGEAAARNVLASGV